MPEDRRPDRPSRPRPRPWGTIGLLGGAAVALAIALVLAFVVLPASRPGNQVPVRPPATSPGPTSGTGPGSTASPGTSTSVPPSSSVPVSRGNPPIPAPRGPTVTIGTAGDGRTVTLEPGQRLAVRLQPSGRRRWSIPRSGDQIVLARRASSADRSDGSSSATFLARTRGSTDVQAVASPTCTPACGVASRTWSIRVVVR